MVVADDYCVSPRSKSFFFFFFVGTFIQLGGLFGQGLGPGLGPGLDNSFPPFLRCNNICVYVRKSVFLKCQQAGQA